MSESLTCTGCGLTDLAPDPALSGVQPDPVTKALLCGVCFGERHPAAVARFEERNGYKPVSAASEEESDVGGKTPTPRGGRGFATLRRCDVGAMLTTEPEPIDWLAQGIVARGYLSLLVGREKTGKSLWRSRSPPGARRAAATSRASMRARTGAVRRLRERRAGDPPPRPRARPHEPGRARGLSRVSASTSATGSTNSTRCSTDMKPDLVWLDSWRSMWGGDENIGAGVVRVLDPLRELIRRHNVGAGAAAPREQARPYRGSTAVGACVETIIEFSKAEGDDGPPPAAAAQLRVQV